jgi:hypothetical protein
MRKILSIITKVLLVAASGYGIFLVHRAENSWWLDIFLAILAIQLLTALFNLLDNGNAWKKVIAGFSTTAISFLIASVVFLYIKPSWFLAALLGVVGGFIINMVFVWNEVMAQVALTQAQNLLKSDKKEAIRNATRARDLYMKRRLKAGQADAEAFLAEAYSGTQTTQAIRYANNALSIYRDLNNHNQMSKMRKMLNGFKVRGFDIKGSESALKSEFRLDYQVFIQGFLWIASWVVILQIWQFEQLQGSLSNLIFAGVSLLILSYGISFIQSMVEFHKKSSGFSHFLFFIGWLFANVGGFAWWIRNPKFELSDMPQLFHNPIRLFADFLIAVPEWAAFVALGLGIVAGVFAFLRLRDRLEERKPFSLDIFGGNAAKKKIIAAREHLKASEWSQAIMALNQVDLTQKRNQTYQSEVLFNLSFAHYRSKHLIEAKQFLKELLLAEKNSKHALYLLGYIHLSENELDEAEKVWRSLVAHDRSFSPRDNKSDRSARHYLCVTLYRKAAGLVGKDDEAVSKLITEVSQLGTLNQEMADVLVRINLNTFCQAVRQNDWQRANTVLTSIQQQLKHLEGLVKNEKDLKKIKSLILAAEGLLAFNQNHYDLAIGKFEAAEKETKQITQAKKPKFTDGSSPFDFLLKTLLEAKQDPDKVHSTFPRDLRFMLSISQLRKVHDDLPSLSSRQVVSRMKPIEETLEQVATKNSELIEARGLLGLIYYFFGEDKEKQDFGMEILLMIREGVGSRYINQIVNQYETGKQQNNELKKNYFSLLEQFLHSSTVSHDEREQLRQQLLEQMRSDGKYEEYIGEGKFNLDSDREREPTVKEYIDRMALLHEKMEQIQKMQASDSFSSEVQTLMDELNHHNQSLKDQVQSIAAVEQKLLLAAQKLL